MRFFQGINVVSLTVPDLAAARAFYETTLGLGQPVYDLPDAGWIEFSTGSDSGNLSITLGDKDKTVAQSTTIVLNTADCHATCAALKARGVRCDEPVVFPGFVTFCSFYDPFGNKLQMCSPAPAAS
ncbi:VOC family protein [Ramlibacter pallidus]|uniref:VOC family protein n=1 Tax=Ramlibacter pallidus TaxID=2780087 RepID=A0ABR9S3A7_9BURK|nr:VOC family protein [Ramlibacter pallidus]MBE7367990.1 VOC family protein [Ramlibacter pallidus]